MMGESALIFLFLLGHALGDFYFQSSQAVKRKEQSPRYVLTHAIVYTTCMMFLLLIAYKFNMVLLGLIFLIFMTHLIVDMAKRKAEKTSGLPVIPQKTAKEYLFFIDQSLHIGLLVLFGFLFSAQLTPRLWFVELTPLEMGWSVHPVMVAAGFVFIIRPASLAIEKILGVCEITPTVDSGFANGGKIIGILERLLVYFLLLLGQFSTIGLVVAAKSLARFRDLDDRKCAEYYIIGTFLSLVVVGIVALITIASPTIAGP
ncbi:MAG: DUF3307 domain-containing protein [Peptococcaceae bacterium]|nr:DUF3307 domain-containing protein [Peptococcaceae bacterium]